MVISVRKTLLTFLKFTLICYSKNESDNDQKQDDDHRTEESFRHGPIFITFLVAFWEDKAMICYPHFNQYYLMNQF